MDAIETSLSNAQQRIGELEVRHLIDEVALHLLEVKLAELAIRVAQLESIVAEPSEAQEIGNVVEWM